MTKKPRRRFTVAHCVTDGAPLIALLEILHQDGLPGRPLHPSDRHSWWESPAPDLFVYDLTPYDETAWDFVRKVKDRLPALPILLYPPARRGVGTLLAQCARAYLVHIEPQETPISQPTLRTAVWRALAAAPAARTLHMMRTLLPGRPAFVTRFLAAVLFGLQTRRFAGVPRLTDIARELATTRRSLERVWQDCALASPKELLDWATLLLVTQVGAAAGIGSAAAARAVGLNGQHLYRLRRRLLPSLSPDARHDAPAEFHSALIQFGSLARTRRLRWSRIARRMLA